MSPQTLPPELRDRIARAESIVVFTGAGVSRESGLATFRGEEGLWETYRPEELATPQAFERRPDVVWRWYAWRYRQAAEAEPNPAHRALAELPELFERFTLVTQNVDGLHQRAGSTGVIEVHGSVLRARCHACRGERDMEAALAESPDAPPACDCGGLFRPAVVWFGEPLPQDALGKAYEAAQGTDLLLSVGTSARVFPAAGVIEIAWKAGAAIVEVNPEATGFSRVADLCITRPAGEALPDLIEEMATCRPGT